MAIQIRVTDICENRITIFAKQKNKKLSEKARDDVAKDLAHKIHGQITGRLAATWKNFSEEIDVIDDFAMRFTDVWIIGIADHTEQYSANNAAPDLTHSTELPQDNLIQKSKGFSGDVSGVIGETLFTVILKRDFGLDENDFAHLRAFKGTGEQPDFAIYTPNPLFLNKFSEFKLLASWRPIPCEVKTMSKKKIPAPHEIQERIRDAISQLQNFWKVRGLLENNKCCGVICIVLRNRDSHMMYL